MSEERRAKVLTTAEFKRVVAVARSKAQASRNVALLHMSFGLGLRAKEMTALNIGDVVTPAGTLRDEVMLKSHATKGNKARLLYLSNPGVQKTLLAYLDERRATERIAPGPNTCLFRSQKGGRFTPNTLQQLFSRLYREAGVIGASSHSGRRTFATGLIEKGVDIKAVSRLMGHASVAMTARYVEDNPVRLMRISAEVDMGLVG